MLGPRQKELVQPETLASFLNSLLREAKPLGLKFNLSASELQFENALSLKLLRNSPLGRHQYKNSEINLHNKPITSAQAINWLVERVSNLLGTETQESAAEFINRIHASDSAISEILKDCKDKIESLYDQRELNLIDSESMLYQGHSFHPYPKNRGGLDTSDFKIYSPEYAIPFNLEWALVHPDFYHEKKATHFDLDWAKDLINKNLSKELFESEAQNLLERGWKVLPVHPWQKKHLLKNQRVQEILNKEAIRFLASDLKPSFRATSSVRSLYSSDMPSMLKFSLSMRLTNSIRHLQEVEVVRGMQVHDVFHTDKGSEFLSKHPEFSVLFEGAYAALKDSEGKIIIESIVVSRDNPFTQNQDIGVHVLASLNQRSPKGRYYLESAFGLNSSSKVKSWFQKYLQVVLSPLLDAQANYGIYLGAHQQNLLLKLDESGFPIKSYFRDCQGTGYSEYGHTLYSSECESVVRENGNILTNDMGSMLFCYYLIINSTFNTIITLSEIANISETELIGDLRSFLVSFKNSAPVDSSTIDYLLENSGLWQKGNFGCCLRDINENTIENPMSIYNLIENPLKEGNHV